MFRSYQGESSDYMKKALTPRSLKLKRINSVIPKRIESVFLVFNFLRDENS